MCALREQIERLAPTETTTLIQGETGSGKEVVAQAIHAGSRRLKDRLLVVDCGSLPKNLIESELFGHERGAFTGANASSEGVFESAQGGTVFLDEIGELPLEMQPRLLRVLESRSVRRVGGNRLIPVDVRVIAATNRDLAHDVERGRFREDLYYRLAVVTLRMPPLRQRLEDLPQLAVHLLTELGADPEKHLTHDALALLMGHKWPGNVRELRNALERAVALGEPIVLARGQGGATQPSSEMGARIDLDVPFHQGKREVIRTYERAYITAMLDRCGGNISETARRSGMERASVYRLLQRAGRTGTPEDDSEE
jgi:DNA-binding NtrC family response regulator